MNKLAYVVTGLAALGLAACNNNQDSVENAEMNQPSSDDLNQLANEAASDAANSEAAALGNQQQQLESENATAPADNVADPTDEQEQNVSGM